MLVPNYFVADGCMHAVLSGLEEVCMQAGCYLSLHIANLLLPCPALHAWTYIRFCHQHSND